MNKECPVYLGFKQDGDNGNSIKHSPQQILYTKTLNLYLNIRNGSVIVK